LIIGLGTLAAGLCLPAGAAEAQTTVSLHALAVPTGTGSLRHAMRVNNGAWSTFRDVEVQAGEIGHIGMVEAAAGAEGLHVIATVKEGLDLSGLYHTIRRPNGAWTLFGNVNTQTGYRGPYRSIGMSSGTAGMHVCANSSDGKIWHSIRSSNGTWTRWGDVKAAAGNNPGVFQSMDCAISTRWVGLTLVEELHVVANIASRGGTWHTLRRSNGTWTPFVRVDTTGVAAITDEIDVSTDSSGNLHLVSTNSNVTQRHMIRLAASGAWTASTDIQLQTGDPGAVLASTNAWDPYNGLHLFTTAVISSGNTGLFYSLRNAAGVWSPYVNLRSATGFTQTFGNIASAVEVTTVVK
jgi:hypothetical protein